MRILIIGAVAAGTSAAAKARRNDDAAEIVVYERDRRGDGEALRPVLRRGRGHPGHAAGPRRPVRCFLSRCFLILAASSFTCLFCAERMIKCRNLL